MVVTNSLKLIGAGLAVNELVIRPQIRQSALAVCVLLLVGSQVAEDFVLKVIDRIFLTGGAGAGDDDQEDP